MPRPRLVPKVWLRDSGEEQVANRSPMPARPAKAYRIHAAAAFVAQPPCRQPQNAATAPCPDGSGERDEAASHIPLPHRREGHEAVQGPSPAAGAPLCPVPRTNGSQPSSGPEVQRPCRNSGSWAAQLAVRQKKSSGQAIRKG
jgi:hypothetical protein